jgi:hypothetical protein
VRPGRDHPDKDNRDQREVIWNSARLPIPHRINQQLSKWSGRILQIVGGVCVGSFHVRLAKFVLPAALQDTRLPSYCQVLFITKLFRVLSGQSTLPDGF